MQLITSFSALALYIWLGNGSPIAAPMISPFPDLVPTSEVTLATDDTGERTISPLRVPDHEVTLAKRNAPMTLNNIICPTGFPNLVPTSEVNLATDSGVQSVSPLRIPTAALTLAKRGMPVTVDGVFYSTGYPDLVASSTVDLATDSPFITQYVSPTRMPASSTITLTAAAASSAVAAVRTESVIVECVYTVSGSAYSTTCPSSTSDASATATPVTIDGVVWPTGYPDLIPGTTVNMATHSTFGTRVVSPNILVAATATVAINDDSSETKKVTSGASGLRLPMVGLLKAVLGART